MTFSKGLWTVEYQNGDERAEGQWYNAGPARVWFPYSASDERQEEAKANANLIAAAPEMYEALKKFVDHYGDPFQMARAALAKAEGRQL